MNGMCKDCRFWRKNVSHVDTLKLSSVCLRVDPDELAVKEGTRALVIPFGSQLKTGPGFGCNQFEAK